MGSMSLISYSRYLFVRQSGLRSAPRIASSKTWSRAPAPIVPTTVELSHQLVWVRNYAAKKKSDKNKDKKALDDFLEDFDDDEDDEEEQTQSRTAATGGRETAVAKFVRECQSTKGKGKKDGKGGGGKGREAKGGHASIVTYAEASEISDLDAYWASLDQCVGDLKDHLIKHLTLRSGAALDELQVELEGDNFPLREVASISKKDPKRIIVECSSFPQATKTIFSAIANSGMNLNPQQEGTRIYVPIPKVTKEYRERLSKGAREKCLEAKEGMKKLQSKQISQLGDLELKSKSVQKDHVHAVKDIVMAMTKHFESEADVIMLSKQKELMGK